MINALIFLFRSDSVNAVCAFTVAGLLKHNMIVNEAIIEEPTQTTVIIEEEILTAAPIISNGATEEVDKW